MTAGTPELPDAVPDGNPHYIRAVTELGNEQEVQAQEDIYASNGMKLVAKGTLVNRDLFERLIKHKLKVPLDLQLAAEKQVDAAALAADAAGLLEQDTLLRQLANRAGDALNVKHGFARMKLPPPLNFRLTVMRSQRAELFQHSLRCGLIAHAVAIRMKLSEADQQAILLAALCHDLGEMHTDPALLAPGRRIEPDERRYIRVHPITSYVLLRDLAAPPVASMNAVLQHHERLDGSGYPYGLSDTRITPLGRLMAVVEVTETVLRRFDPQRLTILLRLNRSRFDAQVADTVCDLLRSQLMDKSAVLEEENSLRQLDRLRDLLHIWDTVQAFIEGRTAEKSKARDSLTFLVDRMREFHSVMRQTGIDTDDIESNLNLARQDPLVLNEMKTVLDELVWRMNEIALEIDLKKPELDELSQITLSNFVDALRMKPEQGENGAQSPSP